MVIPIKVEGINFQGVLLYNGSTLNVVYEHCLKELPEKARKRLEKYQEPITSFGNEVDWTKGIIRLEIEVGEYPAEKQCCNSYLFSLTPITTLYWETLSFIQ